MRRSPPSHACNLNTWPSSMNPRRTTVLNIKVTDPTSGGLSPLFWTYNASFWGNSYRFIDRRLSREGSTMVGFCGSASLAGSPGGSAPHAVMLIRSQIPDIWAAVTRAVTASDLAVHDNDITHEARRHRSPSGGQEVRAANSLTATLEAYSAKVKRYVKRWAVSAQKQMLMWETLSVWNPPQTARTASQLLV